MFSTKMLACYNMAPVNGLPNMLKLQGFAVKLGSFLSLSSESAIFFISEKLFGSQSRSVTVWTILDLFQLAMREERYLLKLRQPKGFQRLV